MFQNHLQSVQFCVILSAEIRNVQFCEKSKKGRNKAPIPRIFRSFLSPTRQKSIGGCFPKGRIPAKKEFTDRKQPEHNCLTFRSHRIFALFIKHSYFHHIVSALERYNQFENEGTRIFRRLKSHDRHKTSCHR